MPVKKTSASGPSDIPPRTIPVAHPSGCLTPVVCLVDASDRALDEAALREHARTACASSGARFTSRSYRFPLALIALHDAPIGVDIERVGPISTSFADSIRTPSERAAGEPEAGEADRYFTSLWSSKEALAKALGDPLAYDPRRLDGPGAWPDGESGRWRAAELTVDDGHVAWVCWQRSEP